MDIHRLGDRHLYQSCPDLFRHLTGILIGTVCRSKTRHRHRKNIFFIPSKHIKCFRSNQEGKRRIQPTGNSYHCGSRIGMGKTLLQSHCLDRQDLLAACSSRLFIWRNKRLLWKCSRQRSFSFFYLESYPDQAAFLCCLKCRILSSFSRNSLKVKLRVNNFISIAIAFFQDRSIFCDNIMSAKDKIRCWFSFSCICINISCDQSCRLPCDQLSAIRILSDRLITCGTVYDHSCSFQCRTDTRRNRWPHILADLRCNDQIFHFCCLEKNLWSERDLFSVKRNISRLLRSGSKLTHLIKFPVIRKKCLCRQSQDLSMIQGCRHIVKLSIHLKRNSHKHQQIPVSGKLCDLQQSCLQ